LHKCWPRILRKFAIAPLARPTAQDQDRAEDNGAEDDVAHGMLERSPVQQDLEGARIRRPACRHSGPTAGDKGTTDDYHRDRTQKILVAHPEAGLPAETRQQDALQGRAQAAQYVDADERDADATPALDRLLVASAMLKWHIGRTSP
jgi:hypothetical protein